MTTKAEKRHLERIAAMSCACCGAPGPSTVHHLRDGQGMAQRASNWLVVPLCYACHQGPLGTHGNKTLLRIRKLSELDLLAKVIEEISNA